MHEAEFHGISSGAEIYRSREGFDVVYGEYHFVSPEAAVRSLKEDLAVAKKVIEHSGFSLPDGTTAEKYILYFENNELNDIEEVSAQIVLSDSRTLYRSGSVNPDALIEFENIDS